MRGSVRTERVGLVGVAVAIVVLAGGCAERRVVARPATPPTTATWIAVWAAGVLVALLAGLLLTLPAWRARRGARLAVAVLTVQTGALVVSGGVLTGVAVRSWQLVDQPADAAPAVALVRLSRIDGDTAFFALMVLLLVVVGALVVTLTAMAARFAATDDPIERGIACALLAIELGGAGYAAVRLALGAHGWPYLAPTIALPLLALATATARPHRAPT
jgi:CHASE2 domain-containing sensor protein